MSKDFSDLIYRLARKRTERVLGPAPTSGDDNEDAELLQGIRGWQFLQFFSYFRRFFNEPDSRHFRHKLSSFPFFLNILGISQDPKHTSARRTSGPQNSTNETKITRTFKKSEISTPLRKTCKLVFAVTARTPAAALGARRIKLIFFVHAR